jgi:hypothetical protein
MSEDFLGFLLFLLNRIRVVENHFLVFGWI